MTIATPRGWVRQDASARTASHAIRPRAGPRLTSTTMTYSAAAQIPARSTSGLTTAVIWTSCGWSATASEASACSQRRRPNSSPTSSQVKTTTASSAGMLARRIANTRSKIPSPDVAA
jgi:hypothetical protein